MSGVYVKTSDGSLIPALGGSSGGGGGGGSYVRQDSTLASVTGDGQVVLAAGFSLLKLTSDTTARIRLYRTADARTADALRPANQVPTLNGVLLDYAFGAAGVAWMDPQVDAHVATDGVVYYRVDGTATFTITWQRTE